MRIVPSLLLTVALALPARVAYASPQASTSAGEHYKTRVKIEVSTLAVAKEPNHARDVTESLKTDIVGSLRTEHGLSIVSQGSAPATLTIMVTWKEYGQSTYLVKLAAQTPAGDPVSKVFEFQGLEYELTDRLRQEIPTMLAWLEVSQQTPPSPREQPPNGAATEQTPPDSAKTLSRTEAIGLGLGVGGIVLLVPSAVVLANRGTNMTSQSAENERQKLKPGLLIASAVGTAIGAGLTIAGIGTFAYGRRAKKKKSTSARIVPVFSPSRAGITFTTRF